MDKELLKTVTKQTLAPAVSWERYLSKRIKTSYISPKLNKFFWTHWPVLILTLCPRGRIIVTVQKSKLTFIKNKWLAPWSLSEAGPDSRISNWPFPMHKATGSIDIVFVDAQETTLEIAHAWGWSKDVSALAGIHLSQSTVSSHFLQSWWRCPF